MILRKIIKHINDYKICSGMMYNLPISIRIPDKYPQVPPEVYVVPSYWMYVRESKDVDENGRVRVYLL
jgi:ubiquitin-protein ligase